jgi:transcription elongation factor Elf1|tara:strand:+ start:185 stop:1222 length:1038 start_codon:yes stop_codon:yes gene_type:complete
MSFMSSYIDIKYLNLIQHSLPQFKKKGDFLWNFRCPYCGDSKKSRTKARGFVYQKKNDLFFKCHNCAVGTTVGNLIKYIDSKTYDDYILERYRSGVKSNNPEPEFKFNEPVFRKKGIFENLQNISEMSCDHPARKIIKKRQLPIESLSDLYFCKSFFKFTNSLVPNKFPSLDGDHPRLLIPFRDEGGEIFAYQGRSFGDEQPKYITIRLDNDHDKIFGLDKINNSKKITVVEGPLDSLFLDNCIAVAGSDFSKPLMIGGKLITNDELTVVFDNEPRNQEICKQIKRTIEQGRKVVLWPKTVIQKDINDMILSGLEKEEIKEIIETNTYWGPEAQLRFAEWRKTSV